MLHVAHTVWLLAGYQQMGEGQNKFPGVLGYFKSCAIAASHLTLKLPQGQVFGVFVCVFVFGQFM